MTSLVWLRKNLRIHDNAALLAAARSSDKIIIAFLMDNDDPCFLKNASNKRLRFLFESLRDVDRQLVSRFKHRLLVLKCTGGASFAAQTLVQFAKKYKVDSVHCDLCTEPYSVTRDSEVAHLLQKEKILFKRWATQTLCDPRALELANSGEVPLTYQSFQKVLSKLPIPAPLDIPSSLPASPASIASSEFTIGDDFNDGGGFLPGGESEALKRLAVVTKSSKWVAQFEKPKSSPVAEDPASTTLLSPYLKFGCLSVRTFYQKLRECERKNGSRKAA